MTEYKKHPDYDILCGSDGNVYNLNKKPLVCSVTIVRGLNMLTIPIKNRPNKTLACKKNLHALIFETYNHKINGRKETIKHIDGDKNNNRPENLMVLTRSQRQSQEAYKKSKTICSYTPGTDKQEWHIGINKTAELLAIDPTSLKKALRNGSMWGGRYWFYKTEALKGVRQLRNKIKQ